MILPTLWVEYQSVQEADIYGQPILSVKKRAKVAPVKLNFQSVHTTVRTDSAGSHGHAYEETADVVLLFLPSSDIALDNIITVLENKVTVVGLHPRYTVTGILDHLEVRCTAWK